MKINTILPFLGLILVPSTHAWGTLGHQAVAYIATNFVAEETRDYFQTLLGNRTESYLAGVATTSQLLDPNVAKHDKYIAAKFIVHFVGDIHQPLHAENIDIGGNTIHVNFTGKPTNLHSVWDTAIPEKLVGGYSMADAHDWANVLTAAIKTGIYQYQAKSWLEGMDISDPLTTALGWARDANAFVCTAVMPDGAEVLEGKELSGDYYDGSVPVIQLQVARAGYRLAAWLDMIVRGIKMEL
ncbi:hypothetical protein DSL72_003049 [Monilinia vaccinii-corymbosi]|uniref:Nuclease S1 n=1 Tax=Monilinia vaccinii-corymbosi TaxID=61207 RepID=A0A8A3P173_9HELO|nr:hypothetical protein DSL72_003049 [Monilinia vaccinii-corymbosi]